MHARSMARRNRHDPLQPVNEPRWLVLRNQLSQIDWYVPLLPNADLKASLEAGRQRLIDEGFTMDEMKWYAFVFGRGGAERISLVIEAILPGSSVIGHGSFLGSQAPQ
jgi:hypothetical protein